jgi:hypothetical protein
MPEKSEKKTVQTEQPKEIMFKCQFCLEKKPLSELVMMRQYYPVLTACKTCARKPQVKETKDSEN